MSNETQLLQRIKSRRIGVWYPVQPPKFNLSMDILPILKDFIDARELIKLNTDYTEFRRMKAV